MTRALPRWLQPAPDSLLADGMRQGRAPWTEFIHLLWTCWVFITPAFSGGYTLRWLAITALSYPLFVLLYTRALLVPRRQVPRHALAMVALCLVLLPVYPSGLSYFVFGCVMLRGGRRLRIGVYLLQLLVLNALVLAVATWAGYPWQTLVWMPMVTLVVGLIVNVERSERDKDIVLRLSQAEVRKLAASAERERIGRDLHDLLGHTLSLVALKSDLAVRLLDRDPDAARGEILAVSQVARDALAQVRSAVSGMRAGSIAAELASARLLLECEGIGFDYDCSGLDSAALPAGVEDALAMTVREAVTNIQRHAYARQAHVAFADDAGAMVLRISDDGAGGALVPGNGLCGMRERIEAIGGELRIDSTRAGTRIEARLPHAACVALAGA